MTRGIANDLLNKRFGYLTVVERAASDKQGNAMWKCACDCGNVVVIRGNFLKRQIFCSKQCLMNVRVKDIRGNRYGRLIALKHVGFDTSRKSVWEFQCDCGKNHLTTADRVLSGHTKSCGCLEIESRRTKGGLSKTPEYKREFYMRYMESKRRATLRESDSRVIGLYREAQRLTKDTGVKHEVDHELPLQGKYVSGLHVFENLRVVTRSENRRKSNRFQVDDVC